MASRNKPALWITEPLMGVNDAAEHALALLFLHELSSERAPWACAPPGAAWEDINANDDDMLGPALHLACSVCENNAGDQLDGFFDRCRFAEVPPRMLRAAIDRVQRLPAKLPSATLLADVYQQSRSLTAQQWQGAFFTPYALASALTQIADVGPSEWVLDPACGGGVLLIAALERCREQHGPIMALGLTLIGVEISLRTAQIARASLLLAGAHPLQFHIAVGNALAQPLVGRNRETGNLHTLEFTSVLANPPFGGKTTAADLERDAADGPLEIPEHVLYRPVPVQAVERAAEVTELPPRTASEPESDAA